MLGKSVGPNIHINYWLYESTGLVVTAVHAGGQSNFKYLTRHLGTTVTQYLAHYEGTRMFLNNLYTLSH